MIQPKHVLIYCPVFLPQQSGYVHAFIQLIQTLLNQHIHVDVVTPQPLAQHEEEPFSHPLLRVFRYHPMLNIWGIGLFYHFGKLAGRINAMNSTCNYDMILIETGDAPLLVASLNQLVLQKMAVRFHSTSDTEYLLYGRHKKYRLRRFFWKYLAAGHIKHLVATNTYHLKFAHQQVLQHSRLKSATVVTNIIHVPTNQVNTSSQPINFFMLGRMDEEGYKQKGFKQLLEALPLVAETMMRKKASLTIVGNGLMHESFVRETKPYPFIQVIKELSHQEILHALDQADVVLLPSLYEGVSMFALEALSRGNAVVFTNTGGLVSMVNGNGLLIEPGSAEALARAIIQLLEKENLMEFKQRSIQIATEQYNSLVQFQQFLAVYQAIKQ